jgi:hypothetical protein
MHPSTENIQTVPNESHCKASKSEICVLQVNEDTYGIESCGAEVCRLFFTLSSKQHILHSHYAVELRVWQICLAHERFLGWRNIVDT